MPEMRKVPLLDPAKYSQPAHIIKMKRKKGVVPIFDVKACAGEPSGKRSTGRAHQIGELIEPKHARAGVWSIFMRGKSMEPLLHDGDLLVFDTKVVPHDGDLVVCRIPPYEDAYVKLLTTADLEAGAKLALVPLDGSGVIHVTAQSCDGPWPVIDIIRVGDGRIRVNQ